MGEQALIGQSRGLALIAKSSDGAKGIILWDFENPAGCFVIEAGHLMRAKAEGMSLKDKQSGRRAQVVKRIRVGPAFMGEGGLGDTKNQNRRVGRPDLVKGDKHRGYFAMRA